MEEVCLNREPVFEECYDFGVVGDFNAVENDNGTSDAQPKNNLTQPTIGLEFDSFDDAYDFYNVYAKNKGFGIRVSNSWFRSKHKERYRAKLSCSNAGFKKKSEANNPRPETRTGCPAMMVVRLIDSNWWRIVEVELDHNHTVSPQVTRFYKSHKKILKEAQQPQNPVTEMHTIKLYRTPVMDALSIDKEGVNSMDHVKLMELKEGDALALYSYFCRMKLTNPNFFYLTDLENDGHLRNVFWADARSRVSYSYFCDTILIDTTYLASRYEIPLISFVGVNHHGQAVLLGCGFLGYESVECFVWVFRTLLQCMLGQPPQVIITDQSKAIQAAVSEVFPNARHCYCLWYIMQRVPEKLGGLGGFKAIKKHLNRAVYKSLKISEFETCWAYMIKQHGLEGNKWLRLLYEDRKSWVPVYLKETFLAGMMPINENQRLDSIFEGCLHKHTSVKEFLDKYDLALHRRNLKEAISDLESNNSFSCLSQLRPRHGFEHQLSKAYTKEIFTRVQSEIEGMFSCFNTRQLSVTGQITTYVVKERVEACEGNGKEVRDYEVLYETSQSEIRCICSLFNFRGYLCRHALAVLNYIGFEEIPFRYVLPRWSKDFKRRHDLGFLNVDKYNPVHWHNALYRRAIPVVEAGAQSQEHYKIVLTELEDLLKKFDLQEQNLT